MPRVRGRDRRVSIIAKRMSSVPAINVARRCVVPCMSSFVPAEAGRWARSQAGRGERRHSEANVSDARVRMTSFSPDQTSSTAQTLTSTRCSGSATSRITSSVMSVGTLRRLLRPADPDHAVAVRSAAEHASRSRARRMLATKIGRARTWRFRSSAARAAARRADLGADALSASLRQPRRACRS